MPSSPLGRSALKFSAKTYLYRGVYRWRFDGSPVPQVALDQAIADGDADPAYRQATIEAAQLRAA
jgi:hypothetical protein